MWARGSHARRRSSPCTFAPAWGQAFVLQEGVRSTHLRCKAARCGLLRASPTGRVRLGQGAKLHHSQPCRRGRCVSSRLPGSRCLPCGHGSPTTLLGCNQGAAAGADPQDTHLRALPTGHPADKPASKHRDLPSANRCGSNPTADESMASFLKSLIFLLQAEISLPPPLKDTNYFSRFSASTEINNVERTQTLYALFKLCSSQGGWGLCRTQSLDVRAHFCRQLCSIPSHPVASPPPAPFENRPISSRTGFGAGMGPNPAPHPEGSPELLPAPSPRCLHALLPFPTTAMCYHTHLT